MTMHDAQNPRELALLVLDEIYERGAYANLALNKALRGNGLAHSLTAAESGIRSR